MTTLAAATLPARRLGHQLAFPAALGAVTVVVGALSIWLVAAPGGTSTALMLAMVADQVGFGVSATLLAREPDQRGNATLLGLATVCQLCGGALRPLPGPLNYLTATIGPLFWVFAGWALLRYPRTRIDLRRERVFLVVAALWLGPGHAVHNLSLDPSWYPDRWDAATWWPTLWHSKALYESWLGLVVTVDAAIALWYVVLVVRRVQRLSGVDRWILAPMGASIVAAAAPLLLRPPAFLLHLTALQNALQVAMTAALVGIPAAFTAVLIRQRFTRSAIAEMVTTLTENESAPDLTRALRTALRDPGLLIAYWVPDADQYVDADGRPVELDPTRLAVPVTASDGTPLGVVLADRALANHRSLVDAAISACRLALENARLHAELRAQLDELRASRRRATEAAVAERRRLERDLHDGVQQRLLALTLRLADMRARDLGADDIVERARTELHAALEELRELARGIHPGVLSQSGLGAALEEVVDRLPLAVTLRVEPVRYPPAVEALAYFAVCESLSNVVKHAEASAVSVRVDGDDDEVRVVVSDDGRGGATITRGAGLGGLSDRVRTLNGRLTVHSPVGHGTTVRIVIPCG